MSRKPIIAGNWKMNLLQADAKSLFEGIKNFAKDFSADQLPEIIVAPVFTSLSVVNSLKCSCGAGCDKIAVAGQNCHWEKSGAFTGEVSVEMLADAGCSHVIIGHSERRQYFSETDEMINKKAKAILAGGLIPIICCGETLEQREAGVTEANRVIAMIRNVVKEVSSVSAGDSIRILYGGSVKPNTIEEQMSQSDIDGALVGGASLKADSFNEIIANTMKVSV